MLTYLQSATCKSAARTFSNKKNQGKGEKADGAMPKELVARRARCVEWMSRPSPAGSPYNSDDEAIGENEKESADALLTLAAQELGVVEDREVLEDLQEFKAEGYGDEDDYLGEPQMDIV